MRPVRDNIDFISDCSNLAIDASNLSDPSTRYNIALLILALVNLELASLYWKALSKCNKDFILLYQNFHKKIKNFQKNEH